MESACAGVASPRVKMEIAARVPRRKCASPDLAIISGSFPDEGHGSVAAYFM
jgi:hypothetical protein